MLKYNSKYYISLIISFGVILILFIIKSEDNITTGSISGKIISIDSGKPIQNARISTNPITCVIKTDENGNFTLKNIPAGSYMLSSKKNGFDSKSIDLEINKGENQKFIIKINAKNDIVGLNPILETPSYLIFNTVVSPPKIKKEKYKKINNKTEILSIKKQKEIENTEKKEENNFVKKEMKDPYPVIYSKKEFDIRKEKVIKSNVSKNVDIEIHYFNEYFVQNNLSGKIESNKSKLIHNNIYSRSILNNSLNNVNENFNNSVINQIGFGNFAELDIVDNFNTVIINQEGSGNISKISQNGVFNKVKINQQGN